MPAESCKTVFPVVLIHGAGFRDLKWSVYWGRIPEGITLPGYVFFLLGEAL